MSRGPRDEKEAASAESLESKQIFDVAANRVIDLVENRLDLKNEDARVIGTTIFKSFEVDGDKIEKISGSLPVNLRTVAVKLGYELDEPGGDTYQLQLVHEGGDCVLKDEFLQDADDFDRSDVLVYRSGVTGDIVAESKPIGFDATGYSVELHGERGAAIIDRFRESAEMIIALAQDSEK